MKASRIRPIVVASALFLFGFLAIAPSRAQGGGGGGCCGGSSGSSSNTAAPSMVCGANEQQQGGQCIGMPAVSTTMAPSIPVNAN